MQNLHYVQDDFGATEVVPFQSAVFELRSTDKVNGRTERSAASEEAPSILCEENPLFPPLAGFLRK
jgi:hypothetical protein